MTAQELFELHEKLITELAKALETKQYGVFSQLATAYSNLYGEGHLEKFWDSQIEFENQEAEKEQAFKNMQAGLNTPMGKLVLSMAEGFGNRIT